MTNSNSNQQFLHLFNVNKLTYLLLVLFLAACGGEEFEDLQEFVKKSGEELRGQVDAPPEITLYEPFLYDNSAELPDPFKPKIQNVRQQPSENILGNQPDFNRPKEELENYPLESLKMVGYLHKGKYGNAIIRSSDGKIHHVKSGNYIGLNFGHIISVSETEIKLKEMVQDSGGDWVERESILQLVEK